MQTAEFTSRLTDKTDAKTAMQNRSQVQLKVHYETTTKTGG
jgi:hypothetical protein